MQLKVTSRDRLYIPKKTLAELHLKEGDSVEMSLDKYEKCILIQPILSESQPILMINKRLKKRDLRASERDFLERLRDML